MADRPWNEMVMDLLEKTPLRDSYLISLWANTFADLAGGQVKKGQGVSRDEFNILFTLAACGPTLARDVCAMNHRPKNSISRAVSQLEARGVLSKVVVEGDRRKELLDLTEAGRALYAETLPPFLSLQKAMLAALDYDERRQLESLLKKALLAMEPGGPIP